MDDVRETGGSRCLAMAGRASNDELRAWLGADARSDNRAFQALFQAVAPLLLAYFEGQLRGRTAELEVLTLETLVAVYRHRASYDPRQPVRAWLLDLARLRMVRHRRGQPWCPSSPEGVAWPDPGVERDVARRLRRLARRQMDDVPEARECDGHRAAT